MLFDMKGGFSYTSHVDWILFGKEPRMRSFELFLPTRLIYGADCLEKLSSATAAYGRKALVLYGGGSVVRSGLLDRVKAALPGVECVDFAGIEPNPRIESVRRAVKVCRDESVDFIVAVGGGSVLDASKAIAAGFYYDGDAWDLVLDHSKIGRALPIFAVLTLAATGSEYDGAGVITNEATQEKLHLGALNLFPVASFCDPSVSTTVPAWHTAAGAADIVSHVFEQYFVSETNEVSDGFCEAVLRAVVHNAPKAVADPNDLDARSALMLASSFGCCGLLAVGNSPSPWPCHGIEHEISAFHDVTHGAGLAVITPHWMRYTLNAETAPKFAQLGVNVFGLDPKAGVEANARKAIECTAEFFASIGLPRTLAELKVTDEHFEEMAEHVEKFWYPLANAFRPIDRAGVLEILRASL